MVMVGTSLPPRSNAMKKFLARHAARVLGVLSGFDRVRFRGTFRQLAHLSGMMSILSYLHVLLKDFGDFSQQTTARFRDGVEDLARRKCLHYYVYLLDSMFGLVHVRMQSWFPFNVPIVINGREWLARQMDAAGLLSKDKWSATSPRGRKACVSSIG
jgi:hypothetical protein